MGESELTLRIHPGVPGEVVPETCFALLRFARFVPRFRPDAGVSCDDLEELFSTLTVHWYLETKPHDEWIRRVGKRWALHLHWPGNIQDSELYHATLHLVNRALRLPQVARGNQALFISHDDDHAERDWWGMIDQLHNVRLH